MDGCKKDDNLVYGTMTDQEGNVYKTIIIGAQTWMAENLRTTTYRNGEPIIKVIYSKSYWQQDGGYLDSENIPIFGRLYTWGVISNSNNISPTGWHVPTDKEWTSLITFLGGEEVAGKKMKEKGTAHWEDPMTVPGGDPTAIGTNESGFNAVPAGAYDPEGTPQVKGTYSFFWSSTESESSFAWGRSLVFYESQCFRFEDPKDFAFSLRLVKD
jgi:uncharacterized protein (TIGR02145 family)